jgi:hypothetical protein
MIAKNLLVQAFVTVTIVYIFYFECLKLIMGSSVQKNIWEFVEAFYVMQIQVPNSGDAYP